MNHEQVPVRIQAARRIVASTWPYLSAACFRLVPRRVTHGLPTLAVDKWWRLYYNEEFVEKTPLGQLALAIACHELPHLLNRHMARTPLGCSADKANICQDAAINSHIQSYAEAGIAYRKMTSKTELEIKPGDKWVYPEKVPTIVGGPWPPKLLFEQYLALWKDPPGGKGGNGQDGEGGVCNGNCGSGADGKPRPWDLPPPGGGKGDKDADSNDSDVDGVTESEAQVLVRKTAQAVQEHAQRYPGNLPGGLEEWVAFELAEPQVRWQNLVRAAVRNAYHYVSGQSEATYAKRNSRTQARWRRKPGRRGYILPGSHDPVPRVAGVLDTSGSMGKEDHIRGLTEALGVIRTLGGQGIDLLCCDTVASEFRTVRDPSRILLSGGGGTDMPVGLAKCYEEDYRVVIVFTDGYTGWNHEPPPRGTRVVVCLTQKPDKNFPVPNWAEVVCVAEN